MDPWQFMRMGLERALLKDKERQERDRQNKVDKLQGDLPHLFRYLTLSDEEEEEGDKGPEEKTDEKKKLDKLLGDLAHLFRPSSASYKVVAECCEVLGHLKTVTFEANDEVSPEDWLLTKQNFTEHLRRPGHKLGPVYVQPGNKIVVCPRLPSLSDDEDDEGPDRKRARTAV